MNSRAGREALDHFLATAAIGLALTGLGDVLPSLAAQQQALRPETFGYAVLSLLIAGGTALFSYLKAHQLVITTQVAQALDGLQSQPAAPATPASAKALTLPSPTAVGEGATEPQA